MVGGSATRWSSGCGGTVAISRLLGGGSQHALSSALRKSRQAHREAARVVLMRRARRWDADTPEAVVGGYLALVHRIPEDFVELVVSTFRSLLHVWCTAGWFSKPATHCKFSCGAESRDGRTHGLRGLIFRLWASRMLPRGRLLVVGRTGAVFCTMERIANVAATVGFA